MAVIKEFKDFAMRGNVIDMAVGIVRAPDGSCSNLAGGAWLVTTM